MYATRYNFGPAAGTLAYALLIVMVLFTTKNQFVSVINTMLSTFVPTMFYIQSTCLTNIGEIVSMVLLHVNITAKLNT